MRAGAGLPGRNHRLLWPCGPARVDIVDGLVAGEDAQFCRLCRIQSIPPPDTHICRRSMQSYATNEDNGIPPGDEFAKKKHPRQRRELTDRR